MKLYVGCTERRHKEIGVHAPINARSGEYWRNSLNNEDYEQWRDAEILAGRGQQWIGHNWNSKFARKRLAHLRTAYLRGC